MRSPDDREKDKEDEEERKERKSKAGCPLCGDAQASPCKCP